VGTSQVDKQHTHTAILDAAAAMIRVEGASAVTIAKVMGEVGLTHGGFYAHFGSRDELLVAATRHAFIDGKERLDHLASKLVGLEPLQAFVSIYLSRQHVNSPGIGCAAASLSGDSARNTDQYASAFANGIEEYLTALLARTDPSVRANHDTADETADDIALLLCASIGAVAVARASGSLPLAKRLPKSVQAALNRRIVPHLTS
jgi:TetR/AcrR family transcriptional regulator, transcriptional repressor for nem operon